MHQIQIEDSLKNKTEDWFYDAIYNINSIFYFNNDVEECIENMDENDKIKSLYVLYKILLENTLLPSIKPSPSNGLEFRNKNKKLTNFLDFKKSYPLGIYHCHLNNTTKTILIWYIEKDNYSNLNIKTEYVKHPNDNYKKILTNIYKNSDGFNLNDNKYFKDYFKNIYLSEKYKVINLVDRIHIHVLNYHP